MKKNIKQLLAGALLLPVMVLGASFFTTALQPAPAVHAAFDKGMMDGANSAQGKNQQGDAQLSLAKVAKVVFSVLSQTYSSSSSVRSV